jgi:hypothetical protein
MLSCEKWLITYNDFHEHASSKEDAINKLARWKKLHPRKPYRLYRIIEEVEIYPQSLEEVLNNKTNLESAIMNGKYNIDSTHPQGIENFKSVVIYANISSCCSCCAPKAMTVQEITRDVNRQLASKHYDAVDVASIRKGRSSPSPCNIYPESRTHWFLINRQQVTVSKSKV